MEKITQGNSNSPLFWMEKEFQQQTLHELEKSVSAENKKFSRFVHYNVRHLNSVMGTLGFQDLSYVCSRER